LRSWWEGSARRRTEIVDARPGEGDGSTPSALLHVLLLGHDREVILVLHGGVPSERRLADWLSCGVVVLFTTSRDGMPGTFPVAINFAHVVLARTSPYTSARMVTF
jgi:hypothetical protein